MVFSCMDLLDSSADARPVVAHYHKEVLGNESKSRKGLHQLNVGKSLPIGAYLILALDDEDPAFSKHPVGFRACTRVQLQNSFMVLPGGLSS